MIRINRTKISPKGVPEETLRKFGGHSSIHKWSKAEELPEVVSAAITITRQYGHENFSFRDERIAPHVWAGMIPDGVPLNRIADALSVSRSAPAQWKMNGVSTKNGTAQLVDALHRIGWFQALKEAYEAGEEYRAVESTAEKAERVKRAAPKPAQMHENSHLKGFHFYGEDPRFARLHVGDWGVMSIGPIYGHPQEAAACTSKNIRRINKRNVRYMGSQGENVALIKGVS